MWYAQAVMKKSDKAAARQKRTSTAASVLLHEKYGIIYDEMLQKIPEDMARRFVRSKREEITQAGLAIPESL
jgi:phage terminase Nu1 subunit (DNA packaging protein)